MFSLLYETLFLWPVSARGTSLRFLNAKRLEIVKHRELSDRGRNNASNARRATDTSVPSRAKNITFSNPKASGEPFPSFDIGPSWSGLIPISNAADDTRKVMLLQVSQGTSAWPYLSPSCSSGYFLQVVKEPLTFSSSSMSCTLLCLVHGSTESLEGLTGVLFARRWRVSSMRME